jgi:hypothetical protein
MGQDYFKQYAATQAGTTSNSDSGRIPEFSRERAQRKQRADIRMMETELVPSGKFSCQKLSFALFAPFRGYSFSESGLSG